MSWSMKLAEVTGVGPGAVNLAQPPSVPKVASLAGCDAPTLLTRSSVPRSSGVAL